MGWGHTSERMPYLHFKSGTRVSEVLVHIARVLHSPTYKKLEMAARSIGTASNRLWDEHSLPPIRFKIFWSLMSCKYNYGFSYPNSALPCMTSFVQMVQARNLSSVSVPLKGHLYPLLWLCTPLWGLFTP